MRRYNRFLFAAILTVIFIVNLSVFAKQDSDKTDNALKENDLYAHSAVLMDAKSGRILYGKNQDEVLPMASTTKIMTLIVTLENADLTQILTVSDYAASMPEVSLKITAGENYELKDLLYSLMLESHNDSAVAVAECVGGDVENFAKMMNEKAELIGCNDTYFITPNGLDASETVVDENKKSIEMKHSTTASDLAKIMSYCITKSPKAKEFLNITQTINYSFTNKIVDEKGNISDGERTFSCTNHNAFLGMMEGALTGKTGFTGDAGYCYVGALKRDGKIFVVALLACGWPNNKSYKWSDTKKLMEYGINNYEWHSFDDVKIDKENLNKVIITDGQTRNIGEVAYASLKLIKGNDIEGLLLNNNEEIQIKYNIKKHFTAPVNVGDSAGNIEYIVNEKIWKKDKVIINQNIQKIDFKWCVNKVGSYFEL